MSPPWLGAAAVLYGVMTAVGLTWIGWRGGREELWALLVGASPLVDVLLGVAAGIATALLASLAGRHVAACARAERRLAALVGPMSPEAALFLALVSGVGEEILFRGAVQAHLGLVVTALVFAAVHVPSHRDLVAWTAMTFLVGLGLGALLEWRGSLVAPVALHFTVNLIGLRRLATVAAETRVSDSPAGEDVRDR